MLTIYLIGLVVCLAYSLYFQIVLRPSWEQQWVEFELSYAGGGMDPTYRQALGERSKQAGAKKVRTNWIWSIFWPVSAILWILWFIVVVGRTLHMFFFKYR